MNTNTIQQEKFRILLLNVSSTSFFYEQLVIPFGLVSIASYLEGKKYVIQGMEMNHPPEKIMDRYLKEDRVVVDQLLAFKPDLVAMSTYATNMYNVLFWAQVIKKYLPNTFVTIGGNHVSYIAAECLEKCRAVDAVIRFEGEIPFKRLCDNLYRGSRDFHNIPSLSWRNGDSIQENTQAELIKDLDSLPILNRTFFADHQLSENIDHADIISSRGCPFHCTFCNCNHYWNKRHRTRSIESVIEELKDLIRKYPLKSVRFRDESLTLNKKHCLQICSEIVKNNIRLRFQAHSRLDGLDEDVIKALSGAGFERLFIGVESGSREVLKRLNKGIDLGKLETIISLLRKHKLSFRLSFMSATPEESISKTLKTVRLIKRLELKRDEYYLGYGVDIYPGTEECRHFLKLNPDYQWITKEDHFSGKYKAVKDPSGNVIQPKYKEYGLAGIGIIFFLLSPGYFIDKVKTFYNRLKK